MLKQDLDPLFFLDDQDGSASSSSTPPPPNRRPIAPSSHSSRLATHPAYISHSHLQIQRSRSPSSSSLTTPPSMAKKVHDMKDEMKYLLGKHSLILSDVYEYNAHKRSAIDFRHDAVAICRALLGDDQAISSHFSPYGDMFGSWKHRIETLRFPRRDIVDPQAIQSYLSAILAIKRQLLSFVDCYYCSTKPIEIVLSVDPKDVLVGDSHVCLPLLLSSDPLSHAASGDGLLSSLFPFPNSQLQLSLLFLFIIQPLSLLCGKWQWGLSLRSHLQPPHRHSPYPSQLPPCLSSSLCAARGREKEERSQ
jgi:hypothetical protein